MKQAGRHSERVTFEEYVNRVYGKTTTKRKQEHLAPTEVKTLKSKTQSYRRETPLYQSGALSKGFAPLPEKKTYTGTLVKGIATMHKSNAVPVLNNEDATAISQMRRN